MALGDSTVLVHLDPQGPNAHHGVVHETPDDTVGLSLLDMNTPEWAQDAHFGHMRAQGPFMSCLAGVFTIGVLLRGSV